MKKIMLFCTVFLLMLNSSFSYDKIDEVFYWVNGSGVWSDYFNHWADFSGGPVKNFGKVPDAGDTVFVDDNSFKSGEDILTINIDENAECFNIDFSKATKKVILIKNQSISLKIYGSMYLNKFMDFKVLGSINFEALTIGNIIETQGQQLPNIIFNGIGGGWELKDSLNCLEIYHFNGSLNTKGNNVNCTRYSSNTTNVRELDITNSKIFIRKPGSVFETSSVYKKMSTANSEIIFENESSVLVSGNNSFNNVHFANVLGTSRLVNGKYNKVNFSSNAIFNGDCTFDTLIFSSGKIYTLDAKKIYTINKSLVSKGNCRGFIFIKTSLDDQAATLVNTGEKIEANYTILQNIQTGASGEYVATNSFDLGNNGNWKITGPLPRQLFWVGKGKGYWDDSGNWSETIGGLGGACLPSPVDDVYFNDLSSIDTVITRTSTVLCKSMIWSGSNINTVFKNEVLDPIRIYGSLYLDKDMKYKHTAYIYFESKENGNIIETKGQQLSNIIFNGIGGGWELKDSLNCQEIYHFNGSLNTKGNNANCTRYSSNTTNVRELDISNSKIFIRKPGSVFETSSIYKKISTANSEIIFENESSIFVSGNNSFNNVYFANVLGTSRLFNGKYNKVEFRSNAILNGDCTFDTLIFSAGKIYTLDAKKIYTINKSLVSKGNCRGFIFIKTSLDDQAATLVHTGEKIEANYTILQNIQTGASGEYFATNSFDLGNNGNWKITGPLPRQLYWVGKGKGYWDDSGNWSETIGGLGGACLPSPVDDVYFNDLSSIDTVITRTSTVLCKSMIWSGSNINTVFKNEVLDPIRIYGSMYLDKDMKYKHTAYIYFESKENGNIIETQGQQLPNIIFNGIGGGWELKDSLNCQEIYHFNGSLNTKGNNVNCTRYSSNTTNVRELDISNSKIFIRKPGSVFETNSIFKNISTANSEIIFENESSVLVSGNNSFNNVYFANVLGTSRLFNGKYNKVNFNSNSILYGDCTFDTLIFSPGKIYTLDAKKIYTINKSFNARGNTCFPIYIKSSNSGTQSIISRESGEVSCDFLSLTDIKASGGAKFYAGTYTNAIGSNNEGWIFSNAPGYVYGFGADTILCKGDVLNTYNFNGGLSYLWHDGSTKSFHTVDITGLYWVQVTYGDNCVYSDSINIEIISNAFVNAGPDVLVCQKWTPKQVKVQIKDGIAPYELNWDPSIGISDPKSPSITISNDSTRQYVVNIKSANGCYARDTILYIVIESLKPKITREGLFLKSNFSFGNQWYLDDEIIIGATEQKIFPLKSGIYTVRIIDSNGCKSEVSDQMYYNLNDINNPIIVVGNYQGYPGDQVQIEINLVNKEYLKKNNITKISFDLDFNASLLSNTDFKVNNISNKTAKISFKDIEVDYLSTLPLKQLLFSVGLGNSEQCSLNISNVELTGGNSEIVIINGLFTLLGICNEGGKRLINPDGQAVLLSITPNPSDANVSIDLNLIENGNTSLKIYNSTGEIVFQQNFLNQAGNIKLNVESTYLSNGLYFVSLQTPTILKLKQLIIYK